MNLRKTQLLLCDLSKDPDKKMNVVAEYTDLVIRIQKVLDDECVDSEYFIH